MERDLSVVVSKLGQVEDKLIMAWQIRPTQPKRAAKLTAEAIELLSGIRGLVIGSRDAVLDFYSEK